MVMIIIIIIIIIIQYNTIQYIHALPQSLEINILLVLRRLMQIICEK